MAVLARCAKNVGVVASVNTAVDALSAESVEGAVSVNTVAYAQDAETAEAAVFVCTGVYGAVVPNVKRTTLLLQRGEKEKD
uniref:Uncharacterized protein n=1 Tax=Chromera velia CCMP2878 TaxID=1169474 RepID=A0A0G4HBU2_9ALVE|eukprot:Cvel_25916.t1-p1 / transcript=Cvel_25916.t1 / gene=Cvel_25916 / organism=Chromera_velia_CCMP2878 / gene_product=hypothetical protein / transcript_product=hypothetical protein / location=Cvel_scaffold2996:12024-12263(+) / protein_length=80 / sequence_SO=supercontig / SO=protein_coding / is_pseudo=false